MEKLLRFHGKAKAENVAEALVPSACAPLREDRLLAKVHNNTVEVVRTNCRGRASRPSNL